MEYFNIDQLINDSVVPIMNEAFQIGQQAFLDGKSIEEILIDKKFYTPSGNFLKVYKEAWDAGNEYSRCNGSNISNI